ncbi:MAG TPA: bifunctional fructose-bisphosphatase/inositol-phosphate phosphatase [Candidatus Acidoferrales bacterium]|nr:bifunctional fructose-bisphosphatase/inositol-phosphate phosphatase [Candidatus Acidoferrales bacterium]
MLKLCRCVADEVDVALSNKIEKPWEIVKIGADGTPTTRMDQVAEDAAITALKNQDLAVRIVSEEIGEHVIGESPVCTVVLDPIDGTYNALKNIPFYSISIAIANNDLAHITFAYIRDLYTKREYWASKGEGAYSNDVQLHVSHTNNLNEFSVSIYGYKRNVERMVKLTNHIRRVRILGCASLELALVAAAKLDAFVDLRGTLRVTDVAAGIRLVEEARGAVTDDCGQGLTTPLDVKQGIRLIASNGVKHVEILRYLQWCGEK